MLSKLNHLRIGAVVEIVKGKHKNKSGVISNISKSGSGRIRVQFDDGSFSTRVLPSIKAGDYLIVQKPMPSPKRRLKPKAKPTTKTKTTSTFFSFFCGFWAGLKLRFKTPIQKKPKEPIERPKIIKEKNHQRKKSNHRHFKIMFLFKQLKI